MRKIAIRMAGLVFYMAAGFVLLFWKLERGGLHNAELLLPLAWLLLGIGFMKQAPGICTLCGVLGVVYAVVYAVCGVRAAGEARRNEENGRE